MVIAEAAIESAAVDLISITRLRGPLAGYSAHTIYN